VSSRFDLQNVEEVLAAGRKQLSSIAPAGGAAPAAGGAAAAGGKAAAAAKAPEPEPEEEADEVRSLQHACDVRSTTCNPKGPALSLGRARTLERSRRSASMRR
jgi:hypothetical protein